VKNVSFAFSRFEFLTQCTCVCDGHNSTDQDCYGVLVTDRRSHTCTHFQLLIPKCQQRNIINC